MLLMVGIDREDVSTPSPRAFEKRRISDLDVTRARIVHRA